MGIMSAKFREKMQKIKTGVVRTGLVVFILGIAVTAVACSDKTNDQDLGQNTNPGIHGPIDGTQTGTQTPSTPSTPDVPVTPDVPDVPDVPDQPDLPDVPDQPDVPDVPVTPEKTEAEYKVECEEIIKKHLISEFNKDNSRYNISNIKNLLINTKTGTAYFNADHSRYSNNNERFFVAQYDENLFEAKSYQEMINKFEQNNFKDINVDFETNTIVKNSVSEEKYNELCEYVLGEVGLEGAEVLNATQFESTGSGFLTNLLCLKSGKIYEINAKVASYGTQEEHIANMLDPARTKTIEIANEENFEDFDMIGISAQGLSFEQEIDGKEVSVQFVNGTYGTYSLDFNYYTFGGDGFGL